MTKPQLEQELKALRAVAKAVVQDAEHEGIYDEDFKPWYAIQAFLIDRLREELE